MMEARSGKFRQEKSCDNAQIDQCQERRELIARAIAQVGSRPHGAAGRQDVIDEYHPAAAFLHLQHAGAVFKVISHIDHRRGQLALLANQYESFVPRDARVLRPR